MGRRKDFFDEEVRNDYLVSAKMKKVWNIELEILEEIDDICKRHNLRYFADFGTLLGGVRHKGFIPWDTDIDISMMRDDYETFSKIAPNELKRPLYFVNAYNDGTLWALSKVGNEKSTALQYYGRKDVHQGIYVDIYPLDDVPDGSLLKQRVFKIQREVWMSIYNPEIIENYLNTTSNLVYEFVLDVNFLKELLKMSLKDKFMMFEKFCGDNFGKSEKINVLSEVFCTKTADLNRSWFDEIEMIQFEDMLIPAPKEYDKVLTARYGKYMEPVIGASCHEDTIFEPDIPYAEYIDNCEKGK